MCDWLIENKEIINMGLQFFMAVIGGLVILSLCYHRKAMLLQKDSIQASMFSEISGRISSIMGEIPRKDLLILI